MSRNRFSIILYVVMLLSITILIYGCRPLEQEEERLTAVEVAQAKRGDISKIIRMTSQFKPVENIMVLVKTPGINVSNVNVRLGDRVKEGDLLFELDKSLVRQQVENTKSSYDMAKENYNRQRELLENQQMSFEDLQVMANRRSINRLVQNNSNIQNIGMESNPETSLIAASAQVNQARMAYASSLRQLNELDYYAPIAGVVSQLNIFENQIAINQQPAVVITNTEKLKSNVFVTERLLDDITINQEVQIETDSGTKSGKVSLINTVADPRTNLYLVEIIVNNLSDDIKIGNFNRVKFEIDKREDVVIIPKDALLFEGQETFVYVEVESQVYKRRVDYGVEQGNYVETLNGIKEGEWVVIRGQQYLKDEMQVQVVRGVENENI